LICFKSETTVLPSKLERCLCSNEGTFADDEDGTGIFRYASSSRASSTADEAARFARYCLKDFPPVLRKLLATGSSREGVILE
jgi:hypothetical protein